MDDVNRRQAMKLAATTEVVATGVAALGAGEAEAQEGTRAKTYKDKDGKEVRISKAMEDNYSAIAELAGEAAHQGFLIFMRKLVAIEPGGSLKIAEDGPSITFDQVGDFFAVLSDARAAFEFGPKITSTQGTKSRPAILDIQIEKFRDKARLISGELSCTGTIRW